MFMKNGPGPQPCDDTCYGEPFFSPLATYQDSNSCWPPNTKSFRWLFTGREESSGIERKAESTHSVHGRTNSVMVVSPLTLILLRMRVQVERFIGLRGMKSLYFPSEILNNH